MTIKNSFYLCVAFITVFLSSCATPSLMMTPPPLMITGPQSSVLRHDITHTVMPGETLFRLSRMYDVPAEQILLKNHLASPALRMGQEIVISRAAPLKEVIPVFPSKKWKYIIIHHSATESDNAISLYAMHQRRGWDSTGYDFIIDNGTKGTTAGHVDATPRWIAQKDGAHCKASDMNTKAIGICLVGNFSKEKVPGEQLRALVHLVRYLQQYYNIPQKNIMGHGQVPGASTECPGKLFPWEKFWAMMSR